MSIPYSLRGPIGIDYYADPDDVWATKKNLQLNGYYRPPRSGMTASLDHQIIDSIKQYQRDNLLQVDGVMMPRGQTERRIHRDIEVAWTYRCTICGAPHAGVFSPKICKDCWNKPN